MTFKVERWDLKKAHQICEGAMEEIGELADRYNEDLHKVGYHLVISTNDEGRYVFDLSKLVPKEN